MYKNILLPTDGSELAARGITHGLELAKAQGSPVTLVTATELWSALEMGSETMAGVSDPAGTYEKAAAEAAAKILASGELLAKQADVPCETIHVSDQRPAEGIINTATAKGCDLIVMSSHGRTGVEKALLGSVANDVLTHCKVPVIIVR